MKATITTKKIPESISFSGANLSDIRIRMQADQLYTNLEELYNSKQVQILIDDPVSRLPQTMYGNLLDGNKTISIDLKKEGFRLEINGKYFEINSRSRKVKEAMNTIISTVKECSRLNAANIITDVIKKEVLFTLVSVLKNSEMLEARKWRIR